MPADSGRGNGTTDSLALRLFVADGAPVSQRAEDRVAAACREVMGDRRALHVIDVRRDPDAALAERVFVTPTLIRDDGRSPQRLMGSFDDPDTIARFLRGSSA